MNTNDLTPAQLEAAIEKAAEMACEKLAQKLKIKGTSVKGSKYQYLIVDETK